MAPHRSRMNCAIRKPRAPRSFIRIVFERMIEQKRTVQTNIHLAAESAGVDGRCRNTVQPATKKKPNSRK
jgi:hypothetical protein